MTRNGYWLSVALGGVAVILAITNAALFSNNRLQQAEINGRAQFIQQSVQLEGLFNEMVRVLVELAARNHDEQLKALLQGVGITYTVSGPSGAQGAPTK